MPSSSKKQARTMTAACKNPKYRKKVGIPKKVACDFHDADRGKYHEDIDRLKNLAGIKETGIQDWPSVDTGELISYDSPEVINSNRKLAIVYSSQYYENYNDESELHSNWKAKGNSGKVVAINISSYSEAKKILDATNDNDYLDGIYDNIITKSVYLGANIITMDKLDDYFPGYSERPISYQETDMIDGDLREDIKLNEYIIPGLDKFEGLLDRHGYRKSGGGVTGGILRYNNGNNIIELHAHPTNGVYEWKHFSDGTEEALEHGSDSVSLARHLMSSRPHRPSDKPRTGRFQRSRRQFENDVTSNETHQEMNKMENKKIVEKFEIHSDKESESQSSDIQRLMRLSGIGDENTTFDSDIEEEKVSDLDKFSFLKKIGENKTKESDEEELDESKYDQYDDEIVRFSTDEIGYNVLINDRRFSQVIEWDDDIMMLPIDLFDKASDLVLSSGGSIENAENFEAPADFANVEENEYEGMYKPSDDEIMDYYDHPGPWGDDNESFEKAIVEILKAFPSIDQDEARELLNNAIIRQSEQSHENMISNPPETEQERYERAWNQKQYLKGRRPFPESDKINDVDEAYPDDFSSARFDQMYGADNEALDKAVDEIDYLISIYDFSRYTVDEIDIATNNILDDIKFSMEDRVQQDEEGMNQLRQYIESKVTEKLTGAQEESINVRSLTADDPEFFEDESLSRYMAEIVVDEMKKGKSTKEISEEMGFEFDDVSYIVEYVKKKNNITETDRDRSTRSHKVKQANKVVKLSYELTKLNKELKSSKLDQNTSFQLNNRKEEIRAEFERLADQFHYNTVDELIKGLKRYSLKRDTADPRVHSRHDMKESTSRYNYRDHSFEHWIMIAWEEIPIIVTYLFTAGSPETRWQPADAPEIDILSIKLKSSGKEITPSEKEMEDIRDAAIEDYSGLEDARGDYEYDRRRDRDLDY